VAPWGKVLVATTVLETAAALLSLAKMLDYLMGSPWARWKVWPLVPQ
jgi:hypothetical protein